MIQNSAGGLLDAENIFNEKLANQSSEIQRSTGFIVFVYILDLENDL